LAAAVLIEGVYALVTRVALKITTNPGTAILSDP